ncbi:MAG: hypothetical protein ACE15E_08745 [Acidobacteriota bacterium]
MTLNLVESVVTAGGTKRIYEDSLFGQNLPEKPTHDGTPPVDRMTHQTDLEECHICGAAVRHSRVLITIRTAMEIARASRSTVQRWIRDGWVESVRLPSGSPRIYLDSLFNEPALPKEAYAAQAYCLAS